jgi:hypothetical protein
MKGREQYLRQISRDPDQFKRRSKEIRAEIRNNPFSEKNSLRLARSFISAARARAKKRGTECNLVPSDILPLPTQCEVTGCLLLYGSAGTSRPHGMATLDCVDPSEGYIKGNIAIISYRANTLKSNATAREINALGLYLAKHGVTYDKE